MDADEREQLHGQIGGEALAALTGRLVEEGVREFDISSYEPVV